MTTYDRPSANAARRKIRNMLKRGVSSIREIQRRSGMRVNRISHHLKDKMCEEHGIVVQVGDQYYLVSYVRRHQRRFVHELREFRDRIVENNVTRRFRPGILGRRVKAFNDQKRTLRTLGITVHVDLGPAYIVREKRKHVVRAIEQPRPLSRNVGRKFEQLHEYRAVLDWVEGFFHYDVPDDLRSVPIDNPDARKKVDDLPSVAPA